MAPLPLISSARFVNGPYSCSSSPPLTFGARDADKIKIDKSGIIKKPPDGYVTVSVTPSLSVNVLVLKTWFQTDSCLDQFII